MFVANKTGRKRRSEWFHRWYNKDVMALGAYNNDIALEALKKGLRTGLLWFKITNKKYDTNKKAYLRAKEGILLEQKANEKWQQKGHSNAQSSGSRHLGQTSESSRWPERRIKVRSSRQGL